MQNLYNEAFNAGADLRDHQAARPAALERDAASGRIYGAGPDNIPGGRDTVGHSSVQAWSAGDLFPAVITVVESYNPPTGYWSHGGGELAARLRWRAFDLTVHGRTERFSTYDDAAAAARFALVNPAAWINGE